jgi:membrane associated rhomboid family serine protease
MPRSTPTTISLPPFSGVTRFLIIANVSAFFVVAILLWAAPAVTFPWLHPFILQPAGVARGEIWQLVTYSFIELGILGILFGMLSLWFCGSIIEGAYGSRFMREVYFTSVIGGAVLASAVSFAHVLHFGPESEAFGAFAGIFGVMMAIAVRMGDIEFLLIPFPIRIRAKWMVAIFILVDVAILLKGGDIFRALIDLSGAFCGYLYTVYAPTRGLAFSFSERIFGLRNSYYRYKRRRAARKFEVYMGKQGRNVKFDKEGRYLDPDQHKDPNDKRWMN